MKKINVLHIIAFIAAIISYAAIYGQTPSIDNHGKYARIVVDGTPMLMIGGELGNSSASTLQDVQRIFPHLKKLGLNTVLAPVSWELIEPIESQFDMSTVDNLLAEAQKNDLKLVILWFGAWKNSMSCYAPKWFKRDTKRFPRVHNAHGKQLEEASSLSQNVLEADKKAFVKLMEHLRDNDTCNVTIMVQVENEIGMVESPRDYSADANKMYKSAVPNDLYDYLIENRDKLHPHLQARLREKKGGTWAEVFGDDIYGEEIFQTYTYAKYVEQIAKAGKRVYDIPMYVNVALDSRGRKPGEYPSAGPLIQLKDIWHATAPSIDVMGVDIYDTGVADWMQKYHMDDNPLFIPEIRLEDRDAMFALYAIGHHDAMGFCPFSIEDYPAYAGKDNSDWKNIDLSQDDQLNQYSQSSSNMSPIAAIYRLLNGAEPLILVRQGTDDMDAVLLDNANRESEVITPDGIRFTIRHSLSLGWDPASKNEVWPEAAALILRLDKEEYLVIGSNVVITFTSAESGSTWQKGDKCIGIANCQEVDLQNGELRVVRHLSGDQTHQGRHINIPYRQYGAQHFKLYKY